MIRPLIKVLLATALCSVAACSDDPETSPDASVVSDAGPDAGTAPDCFERPTTHAELINACTNSQHVDKTPVLPLLGADGTLPPLP